MLFCVFSWQTYTVFVCELFNFVMLFPVGKKYNLFCHNCYETVCSINIKYLFKNLWFFFKDAASNSGYTRRITDRKITTFKLGHPIFDSGIRWCMFP